MKTEMAERNLILPQSAAWTIEQILALNPEPNEFLFEVAGNRIRGHAFNKALKRVCDAVGIPHRSPHKIRKTYGTTLIDSKADEAFIQEQMGHKDIMTTKQYYYFCNKSDTTKREQIDRAINF